MIFRGPDTIEKEELPIPKGADWFEANCNTKSDFWRKRIGCGADERQVAGD
ncbi:hypothetical protein Hanom_Chr08g00757381 [Helianthus anomalus]